jgi:hypothetical protein
MTKHAMCLEFFGKQYSKKIYLSQLQAGFETQDTLLESFPSS